MRLHVLSDLHGQQHAIHLPKVSSDAVVLAGDILEFADALKWIPAQFGSTPVVYVLGNHELHGQELSRFLPHARQAAQQAGIHLLQDSSVVINGVAFLGATFWSDFKLYGDASKAKALAHQKVRDYRLIYESVGRLLTPCDAQRRHEQSLRWITKELKSFVGMPVVVVTHHAPATPSIAPRFAGNLLTASYVSNLDCFLQQTDVDLWVHGHTHTCFDYHIGGVRVLCNPRGYPAEATGFDPTLVVDL